MGLSKSTLFPEQHHAFNLLTFTIAQFTRPVIGTYADANGVGWTRDKMSC